MKGKRGRKKAYRRKLILLAGLVLIAGLGCFLWFYKPDRVQAKVTLEAGEPMAEADDFLKRDGMEASYVTNMTGIDVYKRQEEGRCHRERSHR